MPRCPECEEDLGDDVGDDEGVCPHCGGEISEGVQDQRRGAGLLTAGLVAGAVYYGLHKDGSEETEDEDSDKDTSDSDSEDAAQEKPDGDLEGLL
jgi:hypothetical protein